MGRTITPERKDQIAAARLREPEALGPVLGELVLESNAPVGAIALILQVSEPTVYRWMYGDSEPRDKDKIVKIKKLQTILRKARRAKDTPLAGNVTERTAHMMELVVKHRTPAPAPA